MKKLLTLLFTVGMISSSFSQGAEGKTILAGITLGGALNFNSPQTNTIDSKVGGDFLVGMVLDWNFTDNIALSTGLEFSFNRFSTTYSDSVYYDYSDRTIIQNKNYDSEKETNSFLLQSRKHKSIYLTLPVMLKFQTNFMGYMRYYGKFGVRNDILLMTRVADEGIGYNPSNLKSGESTLDGMHTKGLMSFYKGSIGLSGGAEYNISGSTVLVAEIGFFYGFTETFQQKGSLFSSNEEKDMSLYHVTNGNAREYYAPSLKQSQLILKLAVLF